MRVNCQLERQKEDTEGQRGQGREEDKEYAFYYLTGETVNIEIFGCDHMKRSS